MTETIQTQLQTAVKERPEPKSLDMPDREGWWAWMDTISKRSGVEWIEAESLDAVEVYPHQQWYLLAEPSDADEAPPTDIGELPPTAQDRLKRFVELELQKRDLEQSLKDCKARLAALQSNLIEDFTGQGTQSVRNGGLTCYLARDMYVTKGKGIERQEVCDMLEQIGREDLVSDGYNANSLKAYVLEQITQREELERQIAEAAAEGRTLAVDVFDNLAEAKRIEPLIPLLNIGSVLRIKSRK